MSGHALHQDLAAKFGRETVVPAGPAYHPLICHMTDVAAVTLAMWDLVLPASSRALLSAGMGLSEVDAREWVAFIAGCHDLGKANEHHRSSRQNDHLHLRRSRANGFDNRQHRQYDGFRLRCCREANV